MPRQLSDLCNDFAHHGAVYPFKQEDMLKETGGSAVLLGVRGGICFALSQHFVHSRKREEPIELFLDQCKSSTWFGASMATQSAYMRNARALGKQRWDILGMARSTTERTSWTGHLHSRRAILDAIFTKQGLFILEAFQADRPNGHAIAFDSRTTDCYFFDANSGAYLFKRHHESAFRAWYHEYWEVMGYKRRFNGGNRHLHHFA